MKVTNNKQMKLLEEMVKQFEREIQLAKLLGKSTWDCSCGTNNAAGWPTCQFCFKDKPKP
jgi:hypothetical protein